MATTTSRIDRRTLLKLMGSAGATATVISTAGCSIGQSVSASGLTGGKFDKSVPLATAGPGGNPNWQPGDAVKFLPPVRHPDARHGGRRAGGAAQGKAAAHVRADERQPQVGNGDEGPVPRREGRPLRRVPHLRRRGSDRGRRHRRAERRRLHRQHPPRPRPSDRQGRRSEQDVAPRSSSRRPATTRATAARCTSPTCPRASWA